MQLVAQRHLLEWAPAAREQVRASPLELGLELGQLGAPLRQDLLVAAHRHLGQLALGYLAEELDLYCRPCMFLVYFDDYSLYYSDLFTKMQAAYV